jgi:integrase
MAPPWHWSIPHSRALSQYTYRVIADDGAAAIERWAPASVPPAVAAFARAVVTMAAPTSAPRAKALLFAAAKLGAFAASLGSELAPEAVLSASMIERFVLTQADAFGASTRRTLRSNLRFLARRVTPAAPAPVPLSRERAKAPYSEAEIAAYLSLADAQPTTARRMRLGGLISLGAGAGLMGADLRTVRGADVVTRSGGVLVEVAGRRARVVPLLARYHERAQEAARFAGTGYVVGGSSARRRNVTSGLVAAVAGGADLAALDTSRLRATWLVALAEAIGLKTFMDAAGITCTQRLGDLVATLDPGDEAAAVALLGGRP